MDNYKDEYKEKLTIDFRLVNELGDEFRSSSVSYVFEELGETQILFMGKQFNTFLKQCGYYRKNDYIFMEDVTEEELEALEDYLSELRKNTAD